MNDLHRDRASASGGWPAERMRKRIETDLMAAMRSRDMVAVKTLRSLLGALDNASAVDPTSREARADGSSTEVPRHELSREEIAAIVREEIAERESSAVTYDRTGIREKADELRAGAELLATYLAWDDEG